jgi:Got1/Sft2-like family
MRVSQSSPIDCCSSSVGVFIFRNFRNIRRRYMVFSLMKLLLVVLLSKVSNADVDGKCTRCSNSRRHRLRPWAVPFAATEPPSHTFFEHCVSLSEALEQLRGGSSYQPDDWRNPNANAYRDDDDNDPYRYDSQMHEYDDQDRPPSRRRTSNDSGLPSFIPKVIQKGDRKTGLMLLVSGVSLTFLGITLFFNKTIMRLGNLLCIAGVLLTMGPTQTVSYFVQPEKLRATICLGLGIFLVIIGSPLFGIVLEVFGVLNLFGNMFPILMVFVKQMPVIGELLKSNPAKENKPRSSNRYRDDYEDYDTHGYGASSRGSPESPANQYDYDNPGEYSRDDGSYHQY